MGLVLEKWENAHKYLKNSQNIIALFKHILKASQRKKNEIQLLQIKNAIRLIALKVNKFIRYFGCNIPKFGHHFFLLSS
jgi:hypothetical protein